MKDEITYGIRMLVEMLETYKGISAQLSTKYNRCSLNSTFLIALEEYIENHPELVKENENNG